MKSFALVEEQILPMYTSEACAGIQPRLAYRRASISRAFISGDLAGLCPAPRSARTSKENDPHASPPFYAQADARDLPPGTSLSSDSALRRCPLPSAASERAGAQPDHPECPRLRGQTGQTGE